MTLAYNAGDALGITPTAKGMKWEAVEKRVGDRYETVMEQVPRQGFLKDAGGHLLDGLNAVAAVSPASGTTTGLLAKTAPNAVVTSSAVKSAKESIGGVISGYTRHGSNQAIGRDAGRGVKATEMLDAVKNPNKVVNQSNGGIRYEGSGAKVVVNSDGKVISTFGKARGEAIYTHGKGNNALNRAKELGIEYDPKKIR